MPPGATGSLGAGWDGVVGELSTPPTGTEPKPAPSTGSGCDVGIIVAIGSGSSFPPTAGVDGIADGAELEAGGGAGCTSPELLVLGSASPPPPTASLPVVNVLDDPLGVSELSRIDVFSGTPHPAASKKTPANDSAATALEVAGPCGFRAADLSQSETSASEAFKLPRLSAGQDIAVPGFAHV